MKFSLRKSGFQKRLVVTCLSLAVLPMVFLGFLIFHQSSKALINQSGTQVRSLVQKAVEQLDSVKVVNQMHLEYLIQTASGLVDYIKYGMVIEGGLEENLVNDFEAYRKKYPQLLKTRLFDSKGNEKFNSMGVGKKQTGNMADTPWYKAVLETEAVCFSDMFPAAESDQPFVIMAKTIMGDDGLPAVVIAVDIAGADITRSLNNIRIGEQGFIYAVNHNGDIIAHPDKDRLFNVNISDAPFGKEILLQKNGMMEYDEGGARKIAVFSEYPAMKWIIVSTVGKEDILGPIHRVRLVIIVLGVVFAGIALAVSIFVSFKIVRLLKQAVSSLTSTSSQVAATADQISVSSHSQAESASEQAASLEETSSTLEEISSMTKQNATHTNEADRLMAETNRIIGIANDSMVQLTESMESISAASRETSKIIQSIDEIAFQTNLLALNAAVEAARAGEAGSGFAVVADEVRNLAMRAAEAARNTEEIIEDTLKKVNDGTLLVSNTAKSFSDAAENSRKVGELIGDISSASNEQANGIGQVNQAVIDMEQMTQSSAGMAEESASASEQLNAQSRHMREIVDSLVLLVRGDVHHQHPGESPVSNKPQHMIGSEVQTVRRRMPAGSKKTESDGDGKGDGSF